MRRVAVIDDDPVEMTILSGLAEHVPGSFEFDHYNSVNAFCEDSKASGYDLVFLDRRVPPHSDYVESLPVLEGCGFDGIVVMLTARRLGPGKPKSRLRLVHAQASLAKVSRSHCHWRCGDFPNEFPSDFGCVIA